MITPSAGFTFFCEIRKVLIPTTHYPTGGVCEILRIKVRVQPKASREEVMEQLDGTLKVKTTAPPVKGAANRACIELLAKHFGVKRSNVRIIAGHTSRDKIVEVDQD